MSQVKQFACLVSNEGLAVLGSGHDRSFAAVSKLALPSCGLEVVVLLWSGPTGVPLVCVSLMGGSVPQAAVDEGEEAGIPCGHLMLVLCIS